MRNIVIPGVCVALSLATVPAWAQIAVSSNDHKVTQENGVTKNVVNPPADSITILDLGVLPVKVVGTIDVRERHLFADVASEHVNAIISRLNRTELKGHKLKVKLA